MQPLDTAPLKQFIDEKNIADLLDGEKLKKISSQLTEEIAEDESSRQEWISQMQNALKIARQDLSTKNYPWDKASNVKIPLILSGCMQFNARILPEIVQGDRIVNVAVLREDPTGVFTKIAYSQGRHMSYQLLDVIKNWIPDTDKLLMSLPLVGTVYRKTYFDNVWRIPRVDFCMPDEVIVSQHCTAIEKAQRITHRIVLTTNDIIERMRAGIYKSYELSELPFYTEENAQDFENENISVSKNSVLKNHVIEECHCFLDLDDDDYKEPYIVTIHKGSNKVLRITARYDDKSWLKESGKIIGIKARNYFTDYHFQPSPDGTYLGLGFGQFLYPLNTAINSITNALIDSGHLSNLQSGFISKSLKIAKEKLKMGPGEWQQVNSPSGVSLQQSIMPLPTKEPSGALFNLLQFLMQSSKELSAISEPMQGQLPPPDTPATTVLAVLQQGQKIYSAVFKRLHTALKKEYEKLYDLNSETLQKTETYRLATDSGMVERGQYDREIYGVFPVADPTISSDYERLTKIQALWNIRQDPNINEREVVERYVELLRVPDMKKVLNPPPDPNTPPPPEAQLVMAKIRNLDAQNNKIMLEAEYNAEKLRLDEQRLQLDAATAGINATTEKINTSIALAEFEVKGGEKTLELAERTQALLEKQTAPTFMSLVQPPQQQQAQQQQGTPQGTQPIAPEEGSPTQPQESPQEMPPLEQPPEEQSAEESPEQPQTGETE